LRGKKITKYQSEHPILRGMPPDGTFFLLLAQKKEGKEKGAPVASPGYAGFPRFASGSGNVKNSANASDSLPFFFPHLWLHSASQNGVLKTSKKGTPRRFWAAIWVKKTALYSARQDGESKTQIGCTLKSHYFFLLRGCALS
jgi:hypothetical protein